MSEDENRKWQIKVSSFFVIVIIVAIAFYGFTHYEIPQYEEPVKEALIFEESENSGTLDVNFVNHTHSDIDFDIVVYCRVNKSFVSMEAYY